ncbi:MAG: hypothetical protein LBE89_05800 [Helicobacteraceae bacterium]|nr:hypothetical protein [Helicobacteraceae bacterium]
MAESIEAELNSILSDLERIGQIVAQKEAELGIVGAVALKKADNNCYELALDDKRFFIDREGVETLKRLIADLDWKNDERQ